MTNAEAVLRLLEVIAHLRGEPAPPTPPPGPTPDPTRATTSIRVIIDECHLRERYRTNESGGAIWTSHPRRSPNPHRDRFFTRKGDYWNVYVDGNIKWGKKKGAVRGDHGEHAFEVCEDQRFRNKDGGLIHLTDGHPPLFIFCRFVVKR